MSTITAIQSPLEALERETAKRIARGECVQIIFDLDDTLFLVRPRKRAIFRELAITFAHEPAVANALNVLSSSAIPYDVREAIGTVGIHVESHIDAIQGAFFKRFFDGAYTAHDELNSGAAEYVVRLHEMGAQIVYLSARPEEMMTRTIDTLAAHGFPTLAGTEVILKAHQEQHLGDVEFKGVKAAEIAVNGVVIAVFDNEPANLNVMLPAAPDAAYFLLDTDHSPNPPALVMDAHTIVDFGAARAHLAASLASTPSFKAGGWTVRVTPV